MRHIIRSTAIVFALLISLAFAVSLLSDTGTQPKPLAISELAAKVGDGTIRDITVRGDEISATAGDGAAFTAKKEPAVSLFETLVNAGVPKEKIAAVKVEVKDPSSASVLAASILPIILPFLLVLGMFWYMYRQARQGSMQAFSFGKSRVKLAGMNPDDRKITFRDVAGLHEAKEEVREVVEFLRDPAKFHRLGARIPRGILLVGSPGTGKTLLAKAVANEARVPFFYVSGSEFVEMFVGVGANRVRDTFETAKRAAPAIVFVDEVDAIGRARGAGIGGGHDEREQTLNQILVEMDGFDTNDAVIVMAATNRPDILDPALLRPGRFDRRIILDEPSLNDRIEVLTIHSTGKPIAKNVNLRVVAERTPGFSGADLANLINEAAILAARKGQKSISQDNLLESIEKVMLGPERRSHVLSVKEKEVTAHHEAGHAIVAASLPHSDPVHKVSIISRGRAGGYTLKLPSQDKYLKTKSEFEAELAVLLGGYSAEQLVFNELTTGASNDLKVASDLARRMVTQYGMSDAMGPLSYGETHESIFLGRELMHDRTYSEHIAQQIDAEVRAIIDRAVVTAKRIISDKMDTLKVVAQELITKETLEQEQFYALIGQPAPVQASA
ncbi:MAG: ATP-dependent zinc metalloprotease FtsH [Candidatus Yanofskybacteria bacterium]|nr:ATP-dependent zinc metalloprotease FtsH [Candidatus Yanofskybacteria bacterium]